MSSTVLALWWITLAVVVLLILPAALYLLNRCHRSARHIRLYTAETLEAAEGVARNLAAASRLGQVPAAAGRVQKAASALRAEAEALQRAFRG